MRKFVKGLAIAAIILLVLAVIGISATIGWRPFIGPRSRPLTSRRFESSPARLQRGAYLVEHVAGCTECHTPFQETAAGPEIVLSKKASGQVFPMPGFPGTVVAPNLTPGLANWSWKLDRRPTCARHPRRHRPRRPHFISVDAVYLFPPHDGRRSRLRSGLSAVAPAHSKPVACDRDSFPDQVLNPYGSGTCNESCAGRHLDAYQSRKIPHRYRGLRRLSYAVKARTTYRWNGFLPADRFLIWAQKKSPVPTSRRMQPESEAIPRIPL